VYKLCKAIENKYIKNRWSIINDQYIIQHLIIIYFLHIWKR